MAEAKPIGEVTHYFNNIGVVIVRFSKDVAVGESVQFKGATTDFTHKIESMQFDHKDVDKAKKGQEVGIKVGDRVRAGDKVFEVV
jgi:U32 family peptidase